MRGENQILKDLRVRMKLSIETMRDKKLYKQVPPITLALILAAFNVKFQSKDNKEHPVYATSWGVSTRMVAH